ncbi:MAG: hypothetical protein WDN24_13070 [Sphingomonas sp.]
MASASLAGLRTAEGDILGWTHADQQTDPIDAAAGFAFFESAAAPERLFVKGRRYGRPLVDTLFTAGMSTFETLLTRRVMRDINAQPTMFHRSFFEGWSDPPHDFALDLYAYWTACDAGLEIRRFPVRFGPRVFGTSHWNSGLQGRIKFIRRTLGFSMALAKGAQCRPLSPRSSPTAATASRCSGKRRASMASKSISAASAKRLIVHHDPFADAIDFEAWIAHYAHGTLILNVKEEGLEDRLLAILARDRALLLPRPVLPLPDPHRAARRAALRGALLRI